MRRPGWGAVVFVGAIVAAGLASPPSASFSDVAEDDWFAPSVAWLAESGLTTGTAPGCYQPEQFLTRAQTATFLHRLAETPDAMGQRLDEAVAGQRQIERELESLLSRLDEWNEFQDLIHQTRALRDAQRDVQSRTRGLRGGNR